MTINATFQNREKLITPSDIDNAFIILSILNDPINIINENQFRYNNCSLIINGYSVKFNIVINKINENDQICSIQNAFILLPELLNILTVLIRLLDGKDLSDIVIPSNQLSFDTIFIDTDINIIYSNLETLLKSNEIITQMKGLKILYNLSKDNLYSNYLKKDKALSNILNIILNLIHQNNNSDLYVEILILCLHTLSNIVIIDIDEELLLNITREIINIINNLSHFHITHEGLSVLYNILKKQPTTQLLNDIKQIIKSTNISTTFISTDIIYYITFIQLYII